MKQVAIVTGAGSGIGKAVAALYVEAGLNVVLIDKVFSQSPAFSNRQNMGIERLTFDVSDENEWCQAALHIDRVYGSADILVNCAGISSSDSLEHGSSDVWNSIMNVNARSVYHSMCTFIPVMKKQKSGSIVNLTSVGHCIGIGGGTVYPASKGAIISMSRRVAAEYGKYNIRINTVCPGWIETPMTKNARQQKMDEFVGRQALKLTGQPEDVAQAVFFLTSEKARFITGTEIVVDGGLLIT